MGRPLRARYANTTFIDGVVEMSDSDIDDLIAPLILTVVANKSNANVYGTDVRFNTTGVAPTSPSTGYDSIGNATDVRNSAVGVHPASNTTVTTYYGWQDVNTPSAAQTAVVDAARPVHYVSSGNENIIQEMTNQEIMDSIIAPVIQTMIAGGQGGYYIGPTASGAPVTGTWVSIGTLSDTYYVSSTLTTVSYTLWQRTTGTSAGTKRPLKQSKVGDETRLVEMTDAEIEKLAVLVGSYITTGGVGTYQFVSGAPGSGTWVSRGTFVDQVNDLVDTGYQGAYNTGYTATYTNQFTNIRNVGFTTVFSRSFTNFFTNVFTQGYTQTYTDTFTNTFTVVADEPYTQQYTGVYQSAFTNQFQGAFNTAYGRGYTGTYTGVYQALSVYTQGAALYTGPVLYTGVFQLGYTRSYTMLKDVASFQRIDATGFTGNGPVYAATYQGTFARPQGYIGTGGFVAFAGGTAYTGTYTGTGGTYIAYYGGVPGTGYTGIYSGTYTREFTGSLGYTGNFTGAIYSLTFTGVYDRGYTTNYTSTFVAAAYTITDNTAFSRNYTRAFTGVYSQSFTSQYTIIDSVTYTGQYTSLYTNEFTNVFTTPYSAQYTNSFTNNFTREYTGGFTGAFTSIYTTVYVSTYTRAYTGTYSGLTVQNTTSSTTYTLYVRTA